MIDQERPVFSACGRSYTLRDVATAALFRGEWRQVWAELEEQLACQRHAETQGLEADDDIQAASDQFRYGHDLITAEETEAWLAKRGLTIDDLNDYLVRRHWRDAFPARAAAARPAGGGEMPVEQVWAQVFFTDRFDSIARPFAWRVAAKAEAHAPCDPALLDEARRAFLDRSGLREDELDGWLEAHEMAREWFDELAELEAHYAQAAAAAASPEACRRELSARRLALTGAKVSLAAFDSLEAAQEAMLCVTEDGLSLEEVAEQAGGHARDAVWLLEDMPEDARALLFSAKPGELLPPREDGGRFVILRVNKKTEPSLDDPNVRSRVEEAVRVASLDALADKHVRWIFREH